MRRNLGYLDRGLRFFIATVCLVVAFSREGRDAWFWILLVVGGVSLLSGLSSFSGLYQLFGIDTREKK